VEKIGVGLQGHFNGKSHYRKLGFETFQSHFEVSKDILGLKISMMQLGPCGTILHIDTLQQCKNHINWSLYTKIMPLAG